VKISKLVALIVPLAAALLLSLPFSTAAGIDDLDGDGDIDRHDVQRIINALGDSSNGAGDAREQDGDGTITVLDARRLALKCTRPSCATEGIASTTTPTPTSTSTPRETATPTATSTATVQGPIPPVPTVGGPPTATPTPTPTATAINAPTVTATPTDTPLILIQAVDDVRITSNAPDVNLVVSDVLAIWNATDDEGIQHLIDTLLKFSTDAIPAHDFNTLVSDPDRLESATLILTFEGVGMGFGETHFVELLDPDAEWSEQTVTWNTRPGVDPTQTALSFVLNFIVPFRIDATSLVHGALQATGPPVSIGFQLRRSPSEFSTFTNV